MLISETMSSEESEGEDSDCDVIIVRSLPWHSACVSDFSHHLMTTQRFTCHRKPKDKLRFDVLGTLLHVPFPSQ